MQRRLSRSNWRVRSTFLGERSMVPCCHNTKTSQTLFLLGQVRLAKPVRLFSKR
jgi:hypothetical protein